MKNLLYKFGRILSEGKGRQLLYLSALIAITLTAIILLMPDGGNQNRYKDVLALFFGVDSITQKSNYVIVKLFIFILGTLLFSTFLITVITNIFDNFSSSFKEGRLDVNPKGHVLFLGANHMLPAMLDALSKEPEFKDFKGRIVVLTTSNIEDTRERLSSTFGSKEKAYKKLRRKLALVYGERDNKGSLESVNAKGAKDIYILGEDNEANHDGKSLAAADLIKGIIKDHPNKNSIFLDRCKVFLEDPYSVHSLIVNCAKPDKNDHFCLDIINIYDDIAEKALTERPIDYSFSVKNGEREIDYGIKASSEQHVHLVVSGHGQMSWAFVKTAFSMLHFPNFNEKSLENRTTITIIDEDAGRFKNEFMSLYANIFLLSNVRYEYKENGVRKEATSSPSDKYGNFLDIDWEFIDGDINEPEIRTKLESWAKDDSQSLSVALCDMDFAKNTGAALSLPRIIFENKIPVFAYQPSDSDVLENIRSGFFDKSVFSFGMVSGKKRQEDILFKKREEKAMRVNFAYQVYYLNEESDISPEDIVRPDIKPIKEEWYNVSESDKLSNVYNAASIPIKKRSFGIDTSPEAKPIYQQLSKEACEVLDQVEHRRWVAAELVLGYYPISIKPEEWEKKKKEYKGKLQHNDIIPRDGLNSGEKEKDSALRSITFIDNGNLVQLIDQLENDAHDLEERRMPNRAKVLRHRKDQILKNEKAIYTSTR